MKGQSKSQQPTKPKVLIAEDDPYLSRMYENIFSLEQYIVEMANDGLEVLLKINSFQPTVVLLDIMMPKMDGLEVLERLKSNPATSDIPVIMLSNLSSQKDINTAMNKGAVKYITKSAHNPKEVADLVSKILTAKS